MNMLLSHPGASQDDCDLHWAHVEKFYLLGVDDRRVNFNSVDVRCVKPYIQDLYYNSESQISKSTVSDSGSLELTSDIDTLVAGIQDEFGEIVIDDFFSTLSNDPSLNPLPMTPQPLIAKARAPLSEVSQMSVQCLIDMDYDIAEIALSGGLLDRLMTDHAGSKYLQQNLSHSSSEYRQYLISLMLESLFQDGINMCALAEDTHANYVIQQFFTVGSDKQHAFMLDHFVYACVPRLSRSTYGCRVVQAILSCVKNQTYLIAMVQSFAKQSAGCLADSLFCYNANHVVQAILKLQLPGKAVSFITDELNRNLVGYSINTYACRVLQVHMNVYGGLELNKLFDDDQHLHLCCHKHGNYVIQKIIERNAWFRNKLTQDLLNRQNILTVSCNKFGSNVVETCIKLATSGQLSMLVEKTCANRCYIAKQLTSSRFGNYVIRTLSKSCHPGHKHYLMNAIKRNVLTHKYNKALKKLL